MNFVVKIILFPCFLVLTSVHNTVFAAAENQGIGIYLDQDLFVPFYNEDRDYTMGVAVEFFWAKEKGLYPLDNLVRQAGEWLGINDNKNDIVYSFMLGATGFTPDNLSDTQPIYDDRPYSSLVYLSNKRVQADNKNAVAAELLLGLIGTNLGREAQSFIHSTWRSVAGTAEPVEPRGWSHQISDGGELTMRLRLANSRLQYSRPGIFDVATTLGLSFGFQTNASVAVAFRFGEIKSQFWSLPYDPVNRGSFVPAGPQNEWYLWTAFRAHAVVYDALLQGQFRTSKVRYTSDQLEPYVYDSAAGLTLGFKDSQLTFAANVKSSDLKHTSRRQIWGSINYLFYF